MSRGMINMHEMYEHQRSPTDYENMETSAMLMESLSFAVFKRQTTNAGQREILQGKAVE